MRILHTSDWHLGRTFHRVPLLEAQAAYLDHLVEAVRTHAVDVVVVAGDVYDRAVPSLAAVRLFDDVLHRLADAGVPTVMISGNHDSAGRLGFGAGFTAAGGLHLCTDVAEVGRPVVFADDHGPVAVYGLPYLEPETARHGLGEPALAGHAAAAAERVLQVADGPVQVPDPARPQPAPAGSSLRFEAVTFRWQADRPAVFERLSLDVPAGNRVAILGPSGSGKSTFAALAVKVAAPEAGRVLLGGADLAALRAEDVRARIAWLGQATHLFDDTVRENLKLARPEATDAELWSALDQAVLGETIRALPDGLDTWVGEGGARLSGGQGRRLALARALLSSAPILILDEPAAGLDAVTEQAFLRTLNDVAPGRTVILIAHRLTGVERLDRIWRFSGGGALAAAA